jgi:glycerate kinase
VPVLAIVGGAVDEELDMIYKTGVTSVMTINRLPQTLSESSAHSKTNLGYTVANIMGLIKGVRDSTG